MTALATRRLVLIAALMAAAPVAAGPGTPFSAVAVDVGPLRQKGLGPYAELVGRTLQRHLAEAYADRMVRGRAPRLVVRIDGISLRSYAGSGSRFGLGGGAPTDYLEGEALVLGPHGEVMARHHQLSAVPASSGGAWYDPASESRRVEALAAHFAGWLRRSDI